jgi:hypothetical protein
MRSFLGAALAAGACLALVPAGQSAQNTNGSWGTIRGQIVFGGDPVPAPAKVEVPDDNKDKEFCLSKGPIYRQEWVVNPKNKGVRYVFVWLVPEPGDDTPLPVHPDLQKFAPEVVMDQPCCVFIPHAIGIRKGQKLLVKNSATKAHNVRWLGNRFITSGGNTVVPAGKSLTITNLTASKKAFIPIVSFNCDFHKWMSAKVGVFDNPYFAITDKDGKFQIKNAPAGTYRLKIWHEEVGWRGGAKGRNGMKITIKPGGVTDLGKLGIEPKKQ